MSAEAKKEVVKEVKKAKKDVKKDVKKAKNVRVSPRTFSAKRREQVMERWYALRDKGENAMDAAKKVGVSYLSLHRWEQRFGRKTSKGESSELPPVTSLEEHKAKKATVVETNKAGTIIITTPKGFRVECDDIETAKQLLS